MGILVELRLGLLGPAVRSSYASHLGERDLDERARSSWQNADAPSLPLVMGKATGDKLVMDTKSCGTQIACSVNACVRSICI